jgi:hypothetical protein
MLDKQFIRKPELVQEKAKQKGYNVDGFGVARS